MKNNYISAPARAFRSLSGTVFLVSEIRHLLLSVSRIPVYIKIRNQNGRKSINSIFLSHFQFVFTFNTPFPEIQPEEMDAVNRRGIAKPSPKNTRNSHSSKTVECWNCGIYGHYKNQCKNAPKNQEAKAEANVASTSLRKR